jgi:tRNA threonylcarbamoyl adenosine modification protein YeaZ
VLLAIDTSAGTSVAVLDGEAVLAERSTDDTMRHAEVIGEMIAGALADAAAEPDAVDTVVTGMGPGPFTGLRVGIAAARAFAWARGSTVLPVVSHDAVALAEWAAGARGALVVVTDARRREVYWSAYELGADGIRRTDGPGLSAPDAVPHPHVARVDATRVSAASLGLAARRREAAGDIEAIDEPLYLRSPDVTLSAGRKRVTR